jgi:hypothetical protein
MKKLPCFIASNSAVEMRFVVAALRGQLIDTMFEDDSSSPIEEQYTALYFLSSSSFNLVRL